MPMFSRTFKNIFYVVLFLSNTTMVLAQSKVSENEIEKNLTNIDQLIAVKKYDVAFTQIEKLESHSSYSSSKENILILNLKKAQVYYGNKEQQKAMDLLLKGLDELQQLNLPNLKIRYAEQLGVIFKSTKNYAKSRYYHKIALKNAAQHLDTINILGSYLSIGSTFYGESEIDNAAIDSAIYYYKKIIDFPVTVNTSTIISNSYNNLSVIALIEKDFALAEEYGEKSLEINEQQKDTLGVVTSFVNLSNILYAEKKFKEVKKSYLEAYKRARSLKGEKAFRIKENILYNLSYVSEELGDFENAYFYLSDATNLTDSLADVSRAKNIFEIEAKYNVAKEAEKFEKEKSKRYQTLVLFYSTMFIFITFLILGYISYRNYRLKRKNELDKLVNETQIRIINATIDAKEKERKSIAEILHDSVSALLSSANLHLQATKAQLKSGYPKEIVKAQTIVNEASVKIRDLSHELISSVLLKFGLAFAVHDMCQKYSNSQLTLLSDDNGVKRYEESFEIKIYNIIEELVNNILKHSKATNATIMLAERENNMLSVRMNDDGIGFDPEVGKLKGGLGLSHIEARIKVMKGVFNIVSSKDNGTSIFILVPITDREEEV